VGGYAISSVEKDVLKITVVNRYRNEKPSVAFIKNFGLRSGAIASTVAHDSHNIIAVGVSDQDICAAVNLLIENKGGLSVVNGNEKDVIALPIAGLMSNLSCEAIGNAYAAIDKKVKYLGCKLRAPYMTLSFMALLVIPDLKVSDKGLFSGKKFAFMNLFEK
jgi:adenine deaminase